MNESAGIWSVSLCCSLSTLLSPVLSLPPLPPYVALLQVPEAWWEQKVKAQDCCEKEDSQSRVQRGINHGYCAKTLKLQLCFVFFPLLFFFYLSWVFVQCLCVRSKLHNPGTYKSHSERAQLSDTKEAHFSKFTTRWLFEGAAELKLSECRICHKSHPQPKT